MNTEATRIVGSQRRERPRLRARVGRRRGNAGGRYLNARGQCVARRDAIGADHLPVGRLWRRRWVVDRRRARPAGGTARKEGENARTRQHVKGCHESIDSHAAHAPRAARLRDSARDSGAHRLPVGITHGLSVIGSRSMSSPAAASGLVLGCVTGRRGRECCPAVLATEVERLPIAVCVESRRWVHRHSTHGVSRRGCRLRHGHASFNDP